MPSTRRIIAASILNGLAGGLTGANKIVGDERDLNSEIAKTIIADQYKKSQNQRDYEYFQDLPDEERGDFLAVKSAGQLITTPQGKIIRRPGKTGGDGSKKTTLEW